MNESLQSSIELYAIYKKCILENSQIEIFVIDIDYRIIFKIIFNSFMRPPQASPGWILFLYVLILPRINLHSIYYSVILMFLSLREEIVYYISMDCEYIEWCL